jgi:CheY-like chemotaxis protein
MREEGTILLIEDRQDDVVLLLRSFARAGITNPIQVVTDGEQAVGYLTGSGKYSNRAEFPLPDLILLDLKLPKMDGFDILKWIRMHRDLCNLRVVVLTSSDNIRDVNLAYSLGANSFLVKPVDFEHFVQISQALKGYWLWMSKAPEVSRPTRRNKQRGGG